MLIVALSVPGCRPAAVSDAAGAQSTGGSGAREAAAPERPWVRQPYAPREVWNPLAGRSFNTSVYIFRDWNGNGELDLGEPPFAGVAVRATPGRGPSVIRRTNSFGFANFTNSGVSEGVDIAHPGTWVFEVLPPAGWTGHDRDVRQTVEFSLSDDSRAGIAADLPPRAVGLSAPPSFILGAGAELDSGYVTTSGWHPLSSSDANGRRVVSGISEGTYLLSLVSDSGVAVERLVHTGPIPVYVSVLYAPRRWLPPTHAFVDTLSFEDVGESAIFKLPNLRQVKTSNVVVVDRHGYGGAGYVNAATSGVYVAYGSSGYMMSFTATGESEFDFVQTTLAAGWSEAEGDTVIVGGSTSDGQLLEERLTASAVSPVIFSADWRHLRSLTIRSAHQWPVVIDDLVLRFSSPPFPRGANRILQCGVSSRVR